MIIIFMNLVVLFLIVLWMMFDFLRCEKFICLDEYIFFVCKFFCFNIGFLFFFVVCFYILIVVFFCIYYVFKVRDIFENFNEIKYIGFFMYIFLFLLIVYYFVVFNFESWYVILVVCLMMLVILFGLLICMYGFKMYIVVL